jgi:hypothetical protein
MTIFFIGISAFVTRPPWRDRDRRAGVVLLDFEFGGEV